MIADNFIMGGAAAGQAAAPVRTFYFAAAGTARTSGFGHQAGRLATGFGADLVMPDCEATERVAHRLAQARTLVVLLARAANLAVAPIWTLVRLQRLRGSPTARAWNRHVWALRTIGLYLAYTLRMRT
jgi:cytosine/adenosine deaminase-related metal-dependent hydrolase